jgi:hypothetical protein
MVTLKDFELIMIDLDSETQTWHTAEHQTN